MNEDDVTHVTRNSGKGHEELKLFIDLLASAAMLYYVTHPEMFDGLGDKARHQWGRFVHQVSIWTARQDIRSLPETDK